MALTIDDILKNVSKPARYTGGEYNMAKKDPARAAARFCLCFPDVYEVGMSHLGMLILYHLVNERTDVYCERCFAPWTDMEQALRQAGLPLFSLETGTPLSKFDMIGFSLGYEMCYSNVLSMLDLGGMPLKASERDGYPPVIAGGGCTFNPEPMAPFIDLFVIGEAEEALPELLRRFAAHKGKGREKRAFLKEAAKMEGVYVPSLYTPLYHADNTFKAMQAADGAPPVVRKRLVRDLDASYFPEKPIVPFLNVVHDRITLEVFRGCTRGCRFCQAGFIYRPVREKTAARLVEQAKIIFQNTGHDEISLCSLSTGDYPQLEELLLSLMDEFGERKVSVSLPSLRADTLLRKFADKMKEVRKTGLTLAPEAGTQALRDAINKNITEEDLMKNVRCAFDAGWDSVKLYFMIGLPHETWDDVDGIATLVRRVRDAYYGLPPAKRRRPVNIRISVSSFVPKPGTPFQREPQDELDMLMEKQRYLKEKLRMKGVKMSYHDAQLSFLEAVFSRGDRRLADALAAAFRNGARFDAWAERFDFDAWKEAFAQAGIDPGFYANRRREPDERLPWAHIQSGVDEAYLARECEKAAKKEVTADCREGCLRCGLQRLGVCGG